MAQVVLCDKIVARKWYSLGIVIVNLIMEDNLSNFFFKKRRPLLPTVVILASSKITI